MATRLRNALYVTAASCAAFVVIAQPSFGRR
jgi:hypothetical protein